MIDQYEEGVCMQCKKKVDHELICMSPMGDGPAVVRNAQDLVSPSTGNRYEECFYGMAGSSCKCSVGH